MGKEKKRSWKTNIVLVLILLVIAGGLVVAQIAGRFVPNAEGAVGNTACNLYNGGLFAVSEDKIYFSNLKDRGSLYSMDKNFTGFKFMIEDTVGYINDAGNYVVYSRLNYTRSDGVKQVLQFSQSGVYRVDKKNTRNIGGIYPFTVGAVGLVGNDVYYQKYEKDGQINLYRAGLDGKNDELCLSESVVPGTLTANKVYYGGVGDDHYIYSYEPDTKRKLVIYKGNCAWPALVGGNIYFISITSGYNLARIDEYGGNPTILVKEKCVSYNVTPDERYAVYQIDNGSDNRLEMIDLLSLEKTVIRNGDYNSITIIDDTVFFREFGTDEIYYFNLGSPQSVEIFNPPDLTEEKK